jgi:hypothetical protein
MYSILACAIQTLFKALGFFPDKVDVTQKGVNKK